MFERLKFEWRLLKLETKFKEMQKLVDTLLQVNILLNSRMDKDVKRYVPEKEVWGQVEEVERGDGV